MSLIVLKKIIEMFIILLVGVIIYKATSLECIIIAGFSAVDYPVVSN